MLGWLHKKLDHQQKILCNYIIFVTGAHVYVILCVLGFSSQKIIRIVVPSAARMDVRYIPAIVPSKKPVREHGRPACVKKRVQRLKRVQSVKKIKEKPREAVRAPEPPGLIEQTYETVGHEEFDHVETMREIMCAVHSVWRVPVGVTVTQGCELLVEVDFSGMITRVHLVKSSGKMLYDHAAQRAIRSMQVPVCMRGKKIIVQF